MAANKILNRDLDVKGNIRVNGTIVIDENGNVDAPITTTNATFTGNTTIGDSSVDTNTVNATSTFNAPVTIAAAQGLLSSVANIRANFSPTLVQQALTGAGAVNLTTYYTAITNNGANALTLADSTVIGQLKKVKMIVDPGTDSTLTFNTNATIVFADVGDYAVLIWDGTEWIPIELGNDVDGATDPVYTPAS